MTKKEVTALRFKNFKELMKRYDGSPKKFCDATGYQSQATISQLKGGYKSFGDDIARQLEDAAGLERYALENPNGIGAPLPVKNREPINWPFSVSLDEYLNLPGKDRREIDEAFHKMVIGAQAIQLLSKQRTKA